MSIKLSSVAIVALAGTTAAIATPRETFDLVTINGGSLVGNHTLAGDAAGADPHNSVVSVTATGGYTARSVRLVGTVGTWGAATWGSEARLRVTAPSGESIDYSFSTLQATPAGDISFDIQSPLVPATTTGTWTVTAYETYDDASIDSQYSAVSMTIDDAPPAVGQPAPLTDLGDLSAVVSNRDEIVNLSSATDVRWFKLVLPAVNGGGAGYVDMWGSPLDPTQAITASDLDDTDLALYTDAAVLVAYDDLTGPGFFGQLSFGSTAARPTNAFTGQTAGAAFTGQNGALTGGTYYLAVGQYTMAHPANVANNWASVVSNYTGARRDTVVHVRSVPNTAPTPPVMSNVTAALNNGVITLSVDVAGGQNPNSTALVVTADLVSLGGANGTAMTGGNGFPGTYSVNVNVPANASDFTQYPFTLHTVDGQGRNATDITLNLIGLAAVNWDETADGGGDSGQDLASAQVPTGTGALNVITGTFSGSDVDIYKIRICDEAAFMAATVYGAAVDTQLFIFNADGTGVVTDDDVPAGLPGAGGTNSTITSAIVSADGDYYIAVSRYNIDPVDADGALIWANTPFNTERAPDGPGAANAMSSWTGTLTGDATYRLSFAGACFPGVTPTLCSPADVGAAGGVAGHDRLLNNNDFIAFITLFFAQDAQADLGVAGGTPGHDSAWDNNDFIAFINYFFNDAAACNG